MEYLSQFYAFNRGLVSSLALARLDLKRLALSASIFVNWIPRVLGSMMFRPGLQFVGTTLNNQYATHIDGQFSTSDTWLVELTSGIMRIRLADQIIERPAVTSTFSNWNGSSAYVPGTLQVSTFATSTDLGFWHQNDQAGATSSLFTGGGLALLGAPGGTASAIRDRLINVTGANIGIEHEIAIIVDRGEVVCRIGTAEGDDTYMSDIVLRAGNHSLAITPTGPFYIRLSSYLVASSVVGSVALRNFPGDMQVPTPWVTNADLDNVRWVQSGDVIFVACAGHAPMRIERQDRLNAPASRSWSVDEYFPVDGPFGDLNTGPTMLQTSGLSGDVVVTASAPFFKQSHVGGLFRLTSAGQTVEAEFKGDNVFTDPIEDTGVGSSRAFSIVLSGTWSHGSILTLQRSPTTPGNWTDQATYSAPGTYPFQDFLDNEVIYYRIGIKTGQFGAGDDITAELIFSAGSIDGVIRIRSVSDNTHANASVLKNLGAINTNTQNWYEGDWSPKNGYPTAGTIFGGRQWWAGAALFWGSVSELFDSFSDDTSQGDSATIRGDIGAGPVDNVSWMLNLNNLMIGADGEALVAQASSITGPLTPTDKGLKTSTDVGCAPMRAIKVDTQGIFVARNGSRVYELSADANLYTLVPYIPRDLTELVPEIGVPAFRRMAVQNAKDRRVHCVRSDGQVAIMIYDKTENVNCWLLFQAGGGGIVEDVVILPGKLAAPLEDQVYYVINRTINGQTMRSVEKWSLESQSTGAADTRLVDCHLAGTGSNTTSISLPWLVGMSVCLWGNGVDLGQYIVQNDGTISGFPALNGPYAAGLYYSAQWQSTKLAVGSRLQAPLNQYKTVDHIGFVLQDTHAQGLMYGTDSAHIDGLPTVEDGTVVAADSIWSFYDKAQMPLEGSWSTDPRIFLQAASPRPCTVLGVTIGGDGHDAA